MRHIWPLTSLWHFYLPPKYLWHQYCEDKVNNLPIIHVVYYIITQVIAQSCVWSATLIFAALQTLIFHVVSAPSCIRSCLMLLQSCSVCICLTSLRPTSEHAHCCSSICFPGSCVHNRDVMKGSAVFSTGYTLQSVAERTGSSIHIKNTITAELFHSRDGALLQSTVRRINIKTQCTTSGKRGTHSGWCRRCCHSTRMTESHSSHLLPLRRRSDSWIMFRLFSTGTSQKPQTHFNIINVSQCRNNTN